jgi:hypothetical protein
MECPGVGVRRPSQSRCSVPAGELCGNRFLIVEAAEVGERKGAKVGVDRLAEFVEVGVALQQKPVAANRLTKKSRSSRTAQ